MKFTETELRIIMLALSIAKKKRGSFDPEEKGKSFFSFRRSQTAEKMEQLENDIRDHLLCPDEDE